MSPDPPIAALTAQKIKKTNEGKISNIDTFTQNLHRHDPPKKFYKNKKYWGIGIVIIVLATVAIYLLIYALFPTIAQSSLDHSGISIDSASISFIPSAQQQQQSIRKRDFDIQKTFFMNMQTSFINTGLLSATLSFHNPLNIYYNDTLLGNITLPDVTINGGYGSLNTDTSFFIEDPDYFSAFSADMLTLDQFDWTMKGQADVTGAGRTVTIDLDKTFPIQGMDGFKDVNIQSFNLPGNDPKGGVFVELGLVMKNPSPIGIQLGNVVLQMGYQGANFGVLSAENVTLTKGNNTIHLKGSIKPITDRIALDKFSEMLTIYVSGGVAPTYVVGISASPEGNTPIHWLNNGFHALKLNAPLYNPNGPANIIKGLNMSHVHIEVDPFHPNNPYLSVPNVIADVQSPFGFNFDIYETSHSIILGTNEAGSFSIVNVPWTPSKFDNKTGKLEFSIHGADVAALPERKDAFEAYARDLSNSKVYAVNIQGVAATRVVTPVGNITLGGIAFQAPPITPSLSTRLIQYGELTVLPDTLKTNVTHVAVSMINPFPTDLSILELASNVSYKGIVIGNINENITASPFTIPSRSNATSPPLNMNTVLDPASVAFLLRNLAVDSRMETDPFDGLLNLGGLHIPGQQNVAPTAEVFKGFDVVKFTMEAMKALKVDLGVQSKLRIGNDVSNLTFSQLGVPIHTDKTITDLIPIIGQPIVQSIIDGAKLDIHRVKLYDISNHKAKVRIKGSITNAGPIDSKLSFPKPIKIHWKGRVLGRLKMPSIDVKADKGAHFHLHAHLHITNEDAMEDFAEHLLKRKRFHWHLTDKHTSVTALGYTFKDIDLDKHVTIKGCKGFKGDVHIRAFDLPYDHPDGGIKLDVWTRIYNPAEVGVKVSEIGFHIHYKGEYIGPIHAHNVDLKYRDHTKVKFHGRVLYQDSQSGIDAVSELVNHYIHAKDSYITLKGHYVRGHKGEIKWLTRAFKKLTIKNVKLPGASHTLDLIPDIKLKDAKLDFVKSAYKPPMSSDRTEAKLDKPWDCTIEVTDLTMDATLSYNDRDAATLKLPYVSAHTNSDDIVKTSFHDVPLKSINDDVFEDFFKDITKHSRTYFRLSGTVDAYAKTAAGTLHLTNVYFNVKTYLDGFDNFEGHCTVSDVRIVGGTPDAIQSTLQVSFNNPSEITAKVGDVYFPVIMNEFGSKIGTVKLPHAKIVPGRNTFDATMDIASSDAQALSQLLSDFLTEAYVPLTVDGRRSSTDIGSLKDAFSTIDLATSLTGIPANLETAVQVVVTPLALTSHVAQTTATLFNPLDTPVTLNQARADVFFPIGDEQVKIGQINNISSPCFLPPGQNTVCNPWEIQIVATLPQLVTVLQSNNTFVNLQQNITITVGGNDGFTGSLYYYEDYVTTNFNTTALGGLLLTDVLANITAAANQTIPANITAPANQTIPANSTINPFPLIPLLPQPKYDDGNITSTTTQSNSTDNHSDYLPLSNDDENIISTTVQGQKF